MPKAIRKNVDLSQGHCFPPQVPTEGSLNVWVNGGNGGNAAVRVTDLYNHTHACGEDSHFMGPAVQGSPNVFVNNLAFHRNGDLIDCSDHASNGSPNVLVNGY